MINDLEHRFQYHPPKDEKTKAHHENVRKQCLVLAQLFEKLLPDGREKATAVGKLEESMFWANAAIARNVSTSNS